MKTWIVILHTKEPVCGAHNVMYLMHALNEDIARDACVRAHCNEHPSASVEVVTAYETELFTPVRLMTD